MKILGQVLLWLGFLSGALATVFCTPSKGVEYVKTLTQEKIDEEKMRFVLPDVSGVEVVDDGWHLINWLWYLVSAGVAIAGVVMLYVSKSSEGQQTEKTKTNLKEIKSSLDRLLANIANLQESQHKMPPSKITHYIDCLLYTSPSPRDRTRSRMPSSA